MHYERRAQEFWRAGEYCKYQRANIRYIFLRNAFLKYQISRYDRNWHLTLVSKFYISGICYQSIHYRIRKEVT